MFESVIELLATTIEGMTIDDTRVEAKLRYDNRGEPIDGPRMEATDFRRFTFGWPRSFDPDWDLGDSPATPSHWRAEFPLAIYYPTGSADENMEIVFSMASDDATRLGNHLATTAVTAFNASPVTDFQLMGCQTTHDGIDREGADGLVSSFTLRLRFHRAY